MNLKDILDKMGVPYVMGPYETKLWTHTDPEKEITVSADIAMNPDGDELESQIVFFYEKPPEGKKSTDLVFKSVARPKTQEKWGFARLDVNGENFMEKVPDWEKNTCDFFRVCCQVIQKGEIPDIEEILDDEFFKGGRYRSGRGGGGGGRKMAMKSVGGPPPATKPGSMR